VSGVEPLPTYPLLGAPGEMVRDKENAAPHVAPRAPSIEQLFEVHYPSVWRLLRRFGVPPSQLDDAAQEVFWVAVRRLGDVQPGRERAFLYGVALRIASNLHRRREQAATVAELDAMNQLADHRPSPEQELEQARARELLDSALDQLPLELRTVLVLFELEGLEVRQIAELEQIPLGTASSRLRRAREEFSAIARRVRATLSSRSGK
jgi:RNA polymerase sigma-70 factor, ECF subfamily